MKLDVSSELLSFSNLHRNLNLSVTVMPVHLLYMCFFMTWFFCKVQQARKMGKQAILVAVIVAKIHFTKPPKRRGSNPLLAACLARKKRDDLDKQARNH